MRDDARRTRIILAAATIAASGLAIAGIWLLPRTAVTVLTGGALAGWVHIRSCRIENRAQARARKAVTEANQREAALIAAIGRLSGSPTGPIPVLRDVA